MTPRFPLAVVAIAVGSVAVLPAMRPARSSPTASDALTRTAVTLTMRSGLDEVREVTIPVGTVLRLRLDNGVGSDISRVEDPVRARLDRSVRINEQTVLPAGSVVLGSVTQARQSGKVRGRARFAMRFHTIIPRGDDERYRISTRPWTRVAPGTKKRDAAQIAVPAAGGAIIGGLVGGKKGAGVGAAVGGGAGSAVVLSTRGKEVRVGRGAILAVRLIAPLTIRVT